MLGLAYLLGANAGAPHTGCLRAGGAFGIIAAFAAWYNADTSNSFFVIPVAHFPWSEKGRETRDKVDNSEARARLDV
jgi:succinate-acetate transporter protein